MTSILPAFVVTVTLNVAAQLLLKVGARQPGIAAVFPLSFVNLYTLAGILCFVFALCGYLLILRNLPLVVAQALFSIQFVAIIVAAGVVLGERITVIQSLGMVLIALGLFFVAR